MDNGTYWIEWDFRKMNCYPRLQGAGWIDDVEISPELVVPEVVVPSEILPYINESIEYLNLSLVELSVNISKVEGNVSVLEGDVKNISSMLGKIP